MPRRRQQRRQPPDRRLDLRSRPRLRPWRSAHPPPNARPGAQARLGSADHRSAHGRSGHHVDARRDHDSHGQVRKDIMTDELRLAVERRGSDGAILHTKGYINNVGGEEIASRAYELMDAGCKTLLLDLRETKIVNSIGISILIEIIEKAMERNGRVAFCCLTPVIYKTFHIMGLANYAKIYDSEEAAISELGLAA